ncbi:MAG: nucleotidyl transferase AbiEii/AbiGii toxin family protein [Prevotella sp.]|jgi:predicted nucleotidyltransferase component of viral defense system|nr:nucleotidyl transferase AbiEii/AbiGii toxin family protein [Prevotella sp.]
MIWQKYNSDEKQAILQTVSNEIGIVEQAVEKDWWVTIVLKALSNTSWGSKEVLLFKGGTSLSKGWNLIERFSEDIDIIIDRATFNKPDETKQQRTKIRKDTFHYIKDTLKEEIKYQLDSLGATNYEIEFVSDNSSAMVTVVNVKYKSVLRTEIDYILPQIKIEFSSMAMRDPFKNVGLKTLIHEKYNQVDEELFFYFPTVVPERTFLEKIFLLNEEFQRQNPRHERMARHLYDVAKIIDTDYALKSLTVMGLYKDIILYRKKFYGLDGVDYNKNHPKTIDFCPPAEQTSEWQSDYEKLQQTFIYGESPKYEELIEKLQKFTDTKIRNIEMHYPLIP